MKILILCGGSGTRLWPLSRKKNPKQFIGLNGEKSFLQKTIERNLQLVSLDDLYIITGEIYLDDIRRQVPQFLTENIMLEKDQRGTAPAIYSALRQMKISDEECVLICPSDHLMAPHAKYPEFIRQAEKLAKTGYLVTFGVRPTRPETGYGYIQAKDNLVNKFVEKPDKERAAAYLESGDYFWNSGMFAFTYQVFLEEMQKHCGNWIDLPFELMPKNSIDYALMEKSSRVAIIPLDLVWSDIGSWENLYEVMDKDANQNAIVGDVLAVDTTSSLIFAEGRHISTIGLHNVLIVETDDALLVADKARSQEVKEVVATLSRIGKKVAQEHLTVERPWGIYTVLLEQNRYKIKKIVVHPLQRLSLQLHYHRSEHWVVVSGTAKVTIQGKETIVHEGESIYVPKSAIHRVENPGKVPLEIIEVQVGEYLGEDDILRLEDVYGRIKEEEAFKLLKH